MNFRAKQLLVQKFPHKNIVSNTEKQNTFYKKIFQVLDK